MTTILVVDDDPKIASVVGEGWNVFVSWTNPPITTRIARRLPVDCRRCLARRRAVGTQLRRRPQAAAAGH